MGRGAEESVEECLLRFAADMAESGHEGPVAVVLRNQEYDALVAPLRRGPVVAAVPDNVIYETASGPVQVWCQRSYSQAVRTLLDPEPVDIRELT